MTFKNYLKGYQIIYLPDAQKTLKKIDRALARHIEGKLAALVSGEQNLDIKKLQGYKNDTYRLRVRDVRVLYSVHHHEIIICIIEIGYRGNIYD